MEWFGLLNAWFLYLRFFFLNLNKLSIIYQTYTYKSPKILKKKVIQMTPKVIKMNLVCSYASCDKTIYDKVCRAIIDKRHDRTNLWINWIKLIKRIILNQRRDSLCIMEWFGCLFCVLVNLVISTSLFSLFAFLFFSKAANGKSQSHGRNVCWTTPKSRLTTQQTPWRWDALTSKPQVQNTQYTQHTAHNRPNFKHDRISFNIKMFFVRLTMF